MIPLMTAALPCTCCVVVRSHLAGIFKARSLAKSDV